jgi:hypothetical protein
MKLDYLDQINAYGESILRLCDFDKKQAIQLREALQQTVLQQKQILDFSTLEFIEARDCQLYFSIFEEDEGITTEDNFNFHCRLTLAGFEKMVELLAPFCNKEATGYQWLYDIDNPIDFLFSPSGSW